MMICQLQEMGKHGVASSIMRTGCVIKRTKEDLIQKQKLRSVLLVGRIEGEPNTRAVVQIKNNLAAFGHPKAFMLSETGFQVGTGKANAS